MENRTAGWVLLIIALFVASSLILSAGTPAPLPDTSPQTAFSAERAFAYVSAFAIAPHPLGSAEHDRVRDYLVAQITSLGLIPEVQRAMGVTPLYQVAGTVENIVTRLKGTSGAADAVALVAHYDSVCAGPGAGDDGAGVAGLLETLRALRAGPPLRNDILIVLTDGEEDGLLGASAFTEENPAAKDVRVALNFDNRGDAGEAQLFETSEGNGRLVRIFGQASPHPAGSSLSYEIYKHLPNDTDMTVFKKAGAAGLNFGFIGHWEAYHTRMDNAASLDHGSLQQLGENELSLARSLGDTDLAHLQDRDVVYFSLPGNVFLHYSSSFLWPLAILCGVALFGAIFYANGAWQTRLPAILISLLAHIGALVMLVVVGLGFAIGARWLHLHALPEGPVYLSVLYTLGLLALLAGALTEYYRMILKKIAAPGFFLGGAILLMLLLLAASRWLPGGSYIFVLPLLAGLLATGVAAFRPGRVSLPRVGMLCALSLPALFLFVPLLKGFFIALGLTQMGAPLISLAFGVLFLLLFPFLEAALESSGKLITVVSLAAAIVLCIVAARTTRYTAAHPKASLLAYALDADSGKAIWTSSAARADSWTGHYVGASPRRGKLPDFYPVWYPIEFLQNAAPAVQLASPLAELVDKASDDATRTLHLHISSPRHARTIRVGIPQSEVLSASVNGRDLGKPSDARWHEAGQWEFDYANPPAGGIDVELRVRGAGPVTVVLVDRSSGLPAIPGADFLPRPDNSMAIHSGDQTMVRRSYVFE